MINSLRHKKLMSPRASICGHVFPFGMIFPKVQCTWLYICLTVNIRGIYQDCLQSVHLDLLFLLPSTPSVTINSRRHGPNFSLYEPNLIAVVFVAEKKSFARYTIYLTFASFCVPLSKLKMGQIFILRNAFHTASKLTFVVHSLMPLDM